MLRINGKIVVFMPVWWMTPTSPNSNVFNLFLCRVQGLIDAECGANEHTLSADNLARKAVLISHCQRSITFFISINKEVEC